MTMRERAAQGKLFTDFCEGLYEERLQAKLWMSKLNDLSNIDMELRKINEDVMKYYYKGREITKEDLEEKARFREM